MLQCPACKDYDVHRSKWSGPLERLLAVFLRRPVRCYSCYTRFYVWTFSAVKPRGTRYIPKQKKPAAEPPETESKHAAAD